MRPIRFACALLVLVCAILASSGARSDYAASATWFNNMSPEDRALLQSRLILTGHYFALADSEFGPRTFDAITDFQAQVDERPTGVLSARAQDILNAASAQIFESLGMVIVDDPRGQITLFVPHSLLPRQTETRRGTAYSSEDGAIRLETIRKPHTVQSFEDLYRSLSAVGRSRTVTYTVFDSDRFIVSGMDGARSFYVLFRNTGSDSVGYSVEWDEAENLRGSMLATFLASYSFPTAFAEPLTTDDYASRVPPIESTAPAPSQSRVASGSGFFVSQEGLIVTNHHVVDGCREIVVPDYGTVRLITSDGELDLALLRSTVKRPESWAYIRQTEVQLGENVILLGYPLSRLLNSSLSVGTGIVSSETGIGGERSWFTSNVGVQPGNSGGPIVDAFGRVIGVAVAKFDDSVMMAESGNVAPNFGFAIKSTELLEFLAIFRIEDTGSRITSVESGRSAPRVSEVVDTARDFTVQVICHY